MDLVTLVLLFNTFSFLITWSTKKTLLRYFGWDDRVFPAFSLFQHFNKGVIPNEFHGTERFLNWDVNLEKNSSVKPLRVSFHAFAIPLFGPVLQRHGVGVFAQKAFASGEILERCPCLWVALPGRYGGYGGYDEGTKISPCSSKYSTYPGPGSFFEVRPGMNVTYLTGGYWTPNHKYSWKSEKTAGGTLEWSSQFLQNSVPSFDMNGIKSKDE